MDSISFNGLSRCEQEKKKRVIQALELNTEGCGLAVFKDSCVNH